MTKPTRVYELGELEPLTPSEVAAIKHFMLSMRNGIEPTRLPVGFEWATFPDARSNTSEAAMTHQDIVDQIQGLKTALSEAWKKERARIEAERLSLQELCGGLGHVFTRGDDPFASHRRCVFCQAAETASKER